MIDFELELARSQPELQSVSGDRRITALERLADFQPDVSAINECTVRDGVPVPELVRQLKLAASPEIRPFIHCGATSQDLMDTATVASSRKVCRQLCFSSHDLESDLKALEKRLGDSVVTGRTRMQSAKPIPFRIRLGSWVRPLERVSQRLASSYTDLRRVQFGGPVGNRRALSKDAELIAERLSDALDLADPGHSWHTERDLFVEFGGNCGALCGVLGKFGQDVALMAQMKEITLSGGGRSSSMPHKSNPIAAETLVSLARFSSAQQSALLGCLVHEQERSGAAWMVEWMVLPLLCGAAEASVNCAIRLVRSIEQIGDPA